ncbi:hypothetical protein ACH5RR_041491 [Cinchona calisaya]|uniref:Uncharacterized protein n=1 Tax=Cinchona calisaya TaxID=153742 RepID=A0ABD2XX07_9GENT
MILLVNCLEHDNSRVLQMRSKYGLRCNGEHTEKQMPTGHMRSITFDILSEADSVNISAKLIGAVSQVTDPALKPPNLANQCDTCRPKTEECVKGKWRDSYPPMKFSVSTKDVFTKTAITAEVKESLSRNRSSDEGIASDYWNIIPSDAQQYPSNSRSNKCFLSHAQVYYFLKDVDPRFLQSFLKKSSIFLNCFLLTPNFHRVTEVGQRITFDRSTKLYEKLIGLELPMN